MKNFKQLALALFLTLSIVTPFGEVQAAMTAKDAARIAIALLPSFGYLHSKIPEVNPPADYTFNPLKGANFWSKKNIWNIFDQWWIGQKAKKGATPVSPDLTPSKDCPPSGVCGWLNTYLLDIGIPTAEKLGAIYFLLNVGQVAWNGKTADTIFAQLKKAYGK